MRKIILLPIIVLMTIMMAGMVSAIATFNVSNNGIIAGKYIFNITSTLSNVTNCTFTGSSAAAGGVLSTVVARNETRFGAGALNKQNYTNATLDTASLMNDANDWTFSGDCYNGTSAAAIAGSEAITTITGITVQNSVPTCAFASTLKTGGTYKPTQLWSVTCINATRGTIQFGSNTEKAMAESADVCTYTGDKVSVPQGSYSSVTARVSDGTDITSCKLDSIRIDIGASLADIVSIAAASAEGAKAAEAAPSNNNNLTIIVIIGLAAYWYVRRKKVN